MHGNILVTGSSGQLGREIVRLLRSEKFRVTGVDLLPSDTTDRQADICHKEQVSELTRGMDAVIHTAALHGKHYELNYPREAFIRTNIQGTLHLLNACVENGIRKFLYTSTTSIYGKAMADDEQAVWVTETLSPDPRDIYDITKLTAELLCRDFFEKQGLETTVLRVSRFLPEDDQTRAIHRLYRGLDERDGAMGHLLALKKHFEKFEIFNISGGSAFQQEDLRQLIRDPARVILKYYPGADRLFTERNWEFPARIDRVYVIDKARRELGYSPQYGFESLLCS